MSILSRSLAIRGFLVLAVAAGAAAAQPEPARAENAGIVLADRGDHDRSGNRGHRGWQGDRGDHRGHWRDDGHRPGRHWRPGPPPRVRHHYHASPRRPYYRHCRVEWNFWYGGYVRVCT